MLGWDRHLERWQAAHRAGLLNPVFEGLTYAGMYGAIWIVLALVLAVWWRRPPILLGTLVAILLGFGASEALQAAIPRARPQGHALVSRPDGHSFPSGHATIAFAAATVLAAFVPRGRVAFYALAAAVAWSRVYVGVHYPLDVVAGAALGTALGLAIVRGLPRLAAVRLRSRPATRAG